MISLWLNRGAEHHMTTGASSIYHATPTGFRVYIKREHCHSCSSAQQMQNAQNPLTAELAMERGYHINWVAEDASSVGCTGAGDSGMYGQWQPYCWHADQCTGKSSWPYRVFATMPTCSRPNVFLC